VRSADEDVVVAIFTRIDARGAGGEMQKCGAGACENQECATKLREPSEAENSKPPAGRIAPGKLFYAFVLSASKLPWRR